MIRNTILTLALLLLCAGAAADELLPRPAGLEPNVQFWIRIYTQVDGDGGLIHDAEHLDVVYEELRFPDGLSERGRERKIKRAKEDIRAILKRLASGKRSGLSTEERIVLSRWPRDVSDATLRKASRELRFQLGQADKFRAGLVRAGAWSTHIREVLQENGVPTELAALPHVESSYNPAAYSRIGAAGLWQFTRDTGRRYLRVDHVVDERLDPYKSTEAAARLLRENLRITQEWPLAITAYNHGAGGMRRAAQKLGTRDIDVIVRKYRSRTFGFASRNFYASFLAALEVDRNAARYFGPFQPHAPVEYTLIEMPHYYPIKSVENALGIELSILREHNGSLRPAVWKGSKYIPRGFQLRVPAHLVQEPVPQLLARIPATDQRDTQHIDRYYRVERGDTLSAIARRVRVSESELLALNNLRSRHRIREGQVLILPGGAPVAVHNEPVPEDGIYRVRRGDTISIIARRFDVSESQLVAANDLRNRHRIAVGQRLVIPGAPTPPVAAEPTTAAPVVVAAAAPPAAARASAVPDDSAGAAAVVEIAQAEAPALEDTEADALENIEADALEDAEAGATESTDVAVLDATPPDTSDYAVHANGHVTVQPDETLGHYADWLEIRASQLRRINGMRFEEDLVIGSALRLDFSRVAPEEFERRRLEHHRSLQEEFFDAFVVTGTERHVLRRGDTLWELATRRYRVPVWLLRQYNPDLDLAALPAGVAMVVPVIEPRRG
ncbi:MAG: LysM peptidoglycan-binding domain-containing protein [Myxococcales bacterium]|nr:LysM peptidoglycan-binding domain-containing protein [Myxococcales bacterium]MDH5305750.1 LysM peptidoglycan-binding domain-containing protein [Myxococcales bacterium]MDH5565895.1 LysM peptidoglycan-binding domain-containing protein [Myxococcales bacterium]